MNEECEKIKAVLEELSTSDLTASARLVAVIHALGIEAPSDIERLTGLKEAGARKAKRQLKEYRHQSTDTRVSRHSSTDTIVPTDTPVAHQSVGTCADSRARAYKEFPSGIVIQTEEQTNKQTLSQLNGSASECVRLVHSWMPGVPSWDDDRPRQWINSLISEFGADNAKSAILQTDRKLQQGELIARPLNYVSHIAASLKSNPQAKAKAEPTSSFRDLLERRKARKAAQEAANG